MVRALAGIRAEGLAGRVAARARERYKEGSDRSREAPRFFSRGRWLSRCPRLEDMHLLEERTLRDTMSPYLD